MAVITTNNNAVGNVSDGTKFVGGIAPTTGDTLATNTASDITMDVSLDLGTGGATGTDAITMTGTSRLRFTSAPQVLRGGLTWNRGCRIDCAAGADIGWHMPAGSSYTFGTGTAGSGVQTLVTSGTSWSAPVKFRKLSGAAGDTIQFALDIFTAHVITLNFTRFEGFGSSSVNALTCSGSGAAINWTWNKVAFIDCGAPLLANSSASCTFNVTGLDFRTCKSTTMASLSLTATRSSGTRNLTDVTGYDASTRRTLTLVLRNTTISGRFFNVQIGASSTNNQNNTFDGVFTVRNGDAGSGDNLCITYGYSGTTWQNSAFVRTANAVNGQTVVESGVGAVGKNSYLDNVWDNCDTTMDGDDALGPKAGSDALRNIFTNGAGVANYGGTTGVAVHKHNTHITHSASGGPFGVTIGEVTPTNADFMDSIQDNLYAAMVDQTSGAIANALDLITTAGTYPMNAGVVRTNGYYRQGLSGANITTALWNPALGRLSQVGISGTSGVQYRVTLQTLTAATAYPSLVVSGGPFASVEVGDIVFSTSKGTVAVSSVTSATTIGVDPTTANLSSNLVSGDQVYVLKKLWAGGQTFGVDATHGGSDIYGDPQFVDHARSALTWDTSLGGAGTALNLARNLVTVNGLDYIGAAATHNTAYSTANYIAYMRAGATPTNSAFVAATDTSMAAGTIGAVAYQAPSSGDHIRQQIPHLRQVQTVHVPRGNLTLPVRR